MKQRPILKTFQIFQKDPLNSTNFHKYVDEIPDIVVTVKTESGFYLSGYSENPLVGPKSPNKNTVSKGGVIMSLSNRKSFPLLNGKNSMTYDEFFLIFGNAEIRIKHGEDKVYSNLGIMAARYNCLGSTVNDLLGAGKEREVKMAGFEVHRVIFK